MWNPHKRKRTLLVTVGFRAILLLSLICGEAGAVTTVTRTSSFDYDPNTGLLTKEVVEPGDSNLCLVTAYAYGDGFGNRTQTTVRNCNGAASVVPQGVSEAPSPTGAAVFTARTTSTGYGTDGRFPVTVTNAEGYTENRTFDPRGGTAVSLTGPNQIATTWGYDSYGRRYLELGADGIYTRTDFTYCTAAGVVVPALNPSEACPTISGIAAAYSVKVGKYTYSYPTWAAVGAYTKIYYDGQGRALRTETQGFDGSGTSTLVFQDTQYNNRGQAVAKSRPYYNGSTAYWTTFTYDDLGRVVQSNSPTDVANSGSITSTVYSGLTVSTTDPDGHTTTVSRNVAGLEETVTDANNQTLTKAYDPLGNLVRTIDAKGNVTSIVYDLRGRKTAQYDPDMGVWSYAYNAVGDQVQQTDAKSQIISMTYDVLGRMRTRTGPGLNGSWYYNTTAAGASCTKSIGKLCEVTGDNGYRRVYAYDSLGRASTLATTLGGTAYVASVDYDAKGRVNTQTYPTGVKVRNVYSTLGYLSQVQQVASDGATVVQTLFTANTVNAAGQTTQFTYGNGVVTTNGFADRTGRLLSTSASGNKGAVQNLQFGYDAMGLLNQRQDVLTQVVASYQYDAVNRLVKETRQGGSLTAAQVTSWVYDSLGNIQSRTEAGSATNYTYNSSGAGSSRPHAVGAVGGYVNGVYTPRFYAYDNNGNLTGVTGGVGETVTWTAFDKVASLTQGSKQLTYQYDAEYERAQEVYKLNGAVQRTTLYLNPAAGSGLFYEEESGVAGTKRKHYLSVGGATIAMLTCTATPCTTVANTSLQYWHKDHLGSVSVISDASGNPIERLAYDPFGKRRYSTGLTDQASALVGTNTDRGFTGHEHMDEVGLVNMNGRIYDPAIGRFLSADPIVQGTSSLQTYNRYAYGWNNPLGGADPTGYNWVSDRWHAAFHSTIGRAVIIVAVSMMTGMAATAYVTTAMEASAGICFASTPFMAAVAGGAVGGAAAGLMSSNGRLKNAAQGAVAGGVTAGAMNVAGGMGLNGNYEGQYAMHAAVGCGRSMLAGESCGSGAIAAVVSKGVGAAIDAEWQRGSFANFVASTSAGGLMSELTGGRFVTGAVTAGFQYAYNECGATHRCSDWMYRGDDFKLTYSVERGEDRYRFTGESEIRWTTNWDQSNSLAISNFVEGWPKWAFDVGIEWAPKVGQEYLRYEVGYTLFQVRRDDLYFVDSKAMKDVWTGEYVWRAEPGVIYKSINVRSYAGELKSKADDE